MKLFQAPVGLGAPPVSFSQILPVLAPGDHYGISNMHSNIDSLLICLNVHEKPYEYSILFGFNTADICFCLS